MKKYIDILTKEKYELKIEEEINRRLYEKNHISYDTYIKTNESILSHIYNSSIKERILWI